ncbi:MAG: TerB family tellurite resistance protein [Deltaproteobacteria bacterium]|nr:TerB family tellurite resistance protein [Deltaproteobacteria bacterium]
MSERTVRDLLGGGLRPNDPRRFLIESMMCAMHADGVVDDRENAVIERQVAQHPLFQGLGAAASRTLVELSNDAIRFAGSAIGRAPAIAKGLPARIHRLAAYSMAAEVAAADAVIDHDEMTFLEALRIALRISPQESGRMIEAAKGGWVADYLDDRYLRIRGLIGPACEVFALRALARGIANDEQRFKIRDFFAAIPDLALTKDELDAELYRAFRRPRAPEAQVFGELQHVARGLQDPVDRYWMVVYTLVAEIPATVPSWRVIPFIGVMQASMQITDTDMELAAIDALTFPPALSRPG